jgi:hypothetical protein
MPTQHAQFDIMGGYSKEQYAEFDPQETINMFQVNGVNNKKALFPSPGLRKEIEFVQSPGANGRNCYVFNDRVFAVVGSQVYSCRKSSTGLDHSLIGNINTQIGHVGITNLGLTLAQKQLVFADGVDAWIWKPVDSTFSQIAFGFDIKPIDITTFGSRIIALNGETGQLYYSDINDAASWDVLNILNAQNGDINVACATLGDRLYAMGEVSVQKYAIRQGATLFPFIPAEPLIEIGCASAASVAQNFGILVWLSQTDSGVGSVVATTGGEPEPISDQATDTALDEIGDVSDASGFLYKNENGHIMYRLNLTAGNRSFEYDFSTKKWNRPEYAKPKFPGNRHLGQKHVYFYSKHYVLDYSAPKLYEMSTLYGDDDGVRIRRARISSIWEAPANKRININSVILRLKQGTGGDCNLDEEPLVFLEMSEDEGESYGNQLTADIGRIGRRTWETTFDRGINARSVVFKVEHYSTKPFVMLQADINFDILDSR